MSPPHSIQGETALHQSRSRRAIVIHSYFVPGAFGDSGMLSQVAIQNGILLADQPPDILQILLMGYFLLGDKLGVAPIHLLQVRIIVEYLSMYPSLFSLECDPIAPPVGLYDDLLSQLDK